MRILLIIIMLATFTTFAGCQNRDKKVDKERLLGKDYRLFQETPVWDLAKAVEDEDVSLINQLVTKNKLPINYQESKFGSTLLMLAIENSDYESVKTLLSLGANPNIEDKYRGATAMHSAAQNDDPKYLKILIEYKGNPNALESKPITENDLVRKTPLITVIAYSYPPMDHSLEKVKLLVKAGADINFYNKWIPSLPYSPLSEAIILNRFDIALYLLEQGVHYNGIMFKTQGEPIYILGALRTCIVDINTEQYIQKKKVISFLKSRGLDYDKEPIPEYIEKDIKRRYPNNWQEYLKKY